MFEWVQQEIVNQLVIEIVCSYVDMLEIVLHLLAIQTSQKLTIRPAPFYEALGGGINLLMLSAQKKPGCSIA